MYRVTQEDVKLARELIPRLVEVMTQSSASSIWAKIFDEVLFRKVGRPRNPQTSINDFWQHVIDEAVKE